MCEITNGKIYVADRDLVCYKVMFKREEQLASLHNRYEYEIGQEYCVEDFEYRCLNGDVIYEVWGRQRLNGDVIYEVLGRQLSPFAGWGKFHTIYPNMYLGSIKTDLYCTRCGFYSYTYYQNGIMELESKVLSMLSWSDRIKCVRCRIPEGSKYMVSDNGEVFISERIVIDDAWSLDVL